VGPRRRRGRDQVELGFDPEPVAARREEDADRAGPTVSVCGRRGCGAGWWAGAGPLGEGGPSCGLLQMFSFFFLFHLQIQIFSKPIKLQTTIEFKPGFESNNQKPCTSMYATVNSYISLIN
jgi:hypothetical protein